MIRIRTRTILMSILALVTLTAALILQAGAQDQDLSEGPAVVLTPEPLPFEKDLAGPPVIPGCSVEKAIPIFAGRRHHLARGWKAVYNCNERIYAVTYYRGDLKTIVTADFDESGKQVKVGLKKGYLAERNGIRRLVTFISTSRCLIVASRAPEEETVRLTKLLSDRITTLSPISCSEMPSIVELKRCISDCKLGKFIADVVSTGVGFRCMSGARDFYTFYSCLVGMGAATKASEVATDECLLECYSSFAPEPGELEGANCVIDITGPRPVEMRLSPEAFRSAGGES